MRNVVGVEGTGGGFSQIGNDESGLVDSEAQEFLMLEQQTASNVTPRGEPLTDNVSSSSMRQGTGSALRASFPSQSGATKMHSSGILKTQSTARKTKMPAQTLLGKYNQTMTKRPT